MNKYMKHEILNVFFYQFEALMTETMNSSSKVKKETFMILELKLEILSI